MFDAIVQDFAKRIGIPELQFTDNVSGAVIQLDIQGAGMIFLEKSEENRKEVLLVYMARKYDSYDSKMPQKLLEYCSFDKAHIPSLYGSIVKDNVILGLRFYEGDITSGAELENSIHYLYEKFNGLL